MKKRIVWWGGVITICLFIGGLVYDGVKGYTPSKDGKWEEKIALEDMNDKCEILKIDCSDIRIERRHPPVEGESCQFPNNGKPTCEKTKGFWEFVVRLKTGQEYLIAVLPSGSTPVPVGPLSEISPVESK